MRKMNFPFRLGTYVLLITALVHLIGHFYKRPPANDQERQLLELMTGYRMDVGGIQRSVQQVLSGFSLTFSVLLLFVAALNLAVIRLAPEERRFVHAITMVNTIGTGILLVISAVSFPLPPTLLLGAAYAAFALSLFLQRRPAGPQRS
ncbi:MAG TPA: hypothetical protein VLC48_07480 [Gemmatimonadota bacterium]|nr:hypothetical protein [Gemmatimonadota bacterium]